MSTQPIDAYQSAYGNYTTKSTTSSMEDVLAGNGDSSSSDGAKSLKAKLRSRIESLLSDIPQTGSRLTFQDVMDYRDELRDAFETQAEADLAALGVDTARDFTLSYDATTDTVTADANHPDKKIIDAYFENNEEMRNAFAQVVTYSNLLKPAETKVSPQEMVRQMQLDSMSIWFADNLSASSLSGGLSGYGSLLFTDEGEATYFGLDLQV